MRILLIRPCCIGDVVLATAALTALRRAYPDSHITWGVGGWSRRAVEYHPALDAVLDTGSAALPVKTWGGFWRFVRQMRAGKYDIIVSLVRSPLMSAAVRLSGAPIRAGLDSNGRGFGYTHRAAVDPAQPRHEADIYLDAVRALGVEPGEVSANLPVLDEARATVQNLLRGRGVRTPYLVINPAGGSNPGMVFDSKRWPPANFAALGAALAADHGAQLVLVAGPDDAPIVQAVQEHLPEPAVPFIGELSFPQIGALAAESLLYIGNDTGLTHLAAASGAKTAMILGPSDPARYAPYTPNSLALWKPHNLRAGGVAYADAAWDWARDGVNINQALTEIRRFFAVTRDT